MYMFHLAVHSSLFSNNDDPDAIQLTNTPCRFNSYLKKTSLDGIHPRCIGFMIIQIKDPSQQDIDDVNRELELAMGALERTHPLEHSHLERPPFGEVPFYELNMIYESGDSRFIEKMKYPRAVLKLEENDSSNTKALDALRILAPEIRTNYVAPEYASLWEHSINFNNREQNIHLVEYQWDQGRGAMNPIIGGSEVRNNSIFDLDEERKMWALALSCYRNWHLLEDSIVAIPSSFNTSTIEDIELYMKAFISKRARVELIDDSFGDRIFHLYGDFTLRDIPYLKRRTVYEDTVYRHLEECGIAEGDELRMTEILRRVKKGEMQPKPFPHIVYPQGQLEIPDFLLERNDTPDEGGA